MKLFGNRPTNFVNKLLGIDETYYYYNSREEYYRSLFREDNLKMLYKLVDKNLPTQVTTNQAIKFRDIEFGTTMDEVQKILGTPRYKINNNQKVDNHQVLFYKFKMGGYRAISQLHFLGGYLFYSSYIFKELNTASLKKIEEVLDSKYFSSISGDVLTGGVVADAENNRLFINKGLYLTIKYVSGNRKFHDDLIKQLQARKEKKQSVEKQQFQSLQGSL